MPYVAPIVEGHGEVEALPALLHRIAQDAVPEHAHTLRINAPIRVKSRSFLKDSGYFNKQIALAAAKAAQSNGFVLILLDCDDDCPADIGPRLLNGAKQVRSDVEYLVALASREYESWFVAAAPSLAGLYGLPDSLQAPENAEAIRGAKEWLTARMNESYDPIIHQIEFTRKFDLSAACANASFKRLYARFADALARSTAPPP